jgi:hypothetical protein
VINIVFTNYCIGHNPQVISQLSRGGLNIAVDGEHKSLVGYLKMLLQINRLAGE